MKGYLPATREAERGRRAGVVPAAVKVEVLGAILSSTDPVVLRDTVRDTRIPQPALAAKVDACCRDLRLVPDEE